MAGDTLDIDLASQSFMRDPFPTLTRLRQAGPVVRVKLPLLGQTWVATTHEAVNEVLKDDRTFVRDARHAGQRNAVGFRWWAWLPRTVRLLNENMLSHVRLLNETHPPKRLRNASAPASPMALPPR